MKRILSGILVVIIMVGLVGCASNSAEQSTEPTKTVMPVAVEQIEVQEPVETDNPSPYAAEIINTETRDGMVVVEVEWTNNSDETIQFANALNAQAFQNGIELDDAPLPIRESEQYTDVRPGASLAVFVAFEPRDDSEVDVEISEYAGVGGDVIAKK